MRKNEERIIHTTAMAVGKNIKADIEIGRRIREMIKKERYALILLPWGGTGGSFGIIKVDAEVASEFALREGTKE